MSKTAPRRAADLSGGSPPLGAGGVLEQPVFDVLEAEGRAEEIRACGFRAMLACRIEKGYRHWGHDIGPDDDPLASGLGFAVAWDRRGESATATGLRTLMVCSREVPQAEFDAWLQRFEEANKALKKRLKFYLIIVFHKKRSLRNLGEWFPNWPPEIMWKNFHTC